jgi:hypothetical protein
MKASGNEFPDGLRGHGVFSFNIVISNRVFPRKIEQQHRHRALRGHLCKKVNLCKWRENLPRNPRDEVENPTLLQFSLLKRQLFAVFPEILLGEPTRDFNGLRQTKNKKIIHPSIVIRCIYAMSPTYNDTPSNTSPSAALLLAAVNHTSARHNAGH